MNTQVQTEPLPHFFVEQIVERVIHIVQRWRMFAHRPVLRFDCDLPTSRQNAVEK
jgi:hypothetical protein